MYNQFTIDNEIFNEKSYVFWFEVTCLKNRIEIDNNLLCELANVRDNYEITVSANETYEEYMYNVIGFIIFSSVIYRYKGIKEIYIPYTFDGKNYVYSKTNFVKYTFNDEEECGQYLVIGDAMDCHIHYELL